jgi:hypothetical protein
MTAERANGARCDQLEKQTGHTFSPLYVAYVTNVTGL